MNISPVGHVLPIADRQERRRCAADLFGNTVAVPVDDLRPGADDWSDVADGGALAGDLASILGRERHRRARAEVHAAGGGRPGEDHQRLAPMLAMLFCNMAFDPWPISVMAMTAATAMITPSADSPDRILFRRSAPSAVRHVAGSSDGATACRVVPGVSP